MIIENLDQVTQAVLDEMKRTPDARTKEILESMVRHLHAFVREVKLTDEEFDKAINYVVALGQLLPRVITKSDSWLGLWVFRPWSVL
jgi:catechol 1,2-dioxygenase